MLDSLEALTALHGVSGYEDDVIAAVVEGVRPLVERVDVDPMGNVIGLRPGLDSSAPRILLASHLDEVGFMVRHQEADGSLRLMSVAGHARALAGAELQGRTPEGRSFRAIVGVKSAHQTSDEEYSRALSVSEARVYPLLEDGEELEIPVGSTLTWQPRFHRLPGGLVCAKALDDRVGVAVALEVLRRLQGEPLACHVVFAGTVQEEIACDGALAPARASQVDLALLVDGTVCYDTPDVAQPGTVALGRGPVLTRLLRSPGLNGWTPNPRLALLLEQVARGQGISTQRDATFGLMTDGMALRLGGIPSALVGIPMRHKHSPVELVSEADMEASVALLVAFLRAADAGLDVRRG